MSGGWGGGGWGGAPWGGSAASLLASSTLFDTFCFQDMGMYQILSDPNVTTAGSPSQFVANAGTLDLEVCSGGAFVTDDARVITTYAVPSTFTTEWVVKFDELPTDFTDLVNKHIFLGTFDAVGPLVGLFFSKAGIGYTGSVSFPSGNLQLDCTFQVIPGSSAWVTDTDYLVIRVAADLTLGFVYIYVTPLSELATTGQQLRAIMPVIPYTAAAVPPTDQSIVSVRGTAGDPSCAYLDSWCLGTSLIIPNLAPVANAGLDQAVHSCSVIQLDGSQSFDPEGVPVLYQWRLIDAPLGSEFAIEKADGRTYPLAVPTGYTDRFHSAALGAVDAVDPLTAGAAGDVLQLGGTAYTIIAKGIDGNGFYVQIGLKALEEPQSGLGFKVLRQRGISNSNTATPTFFPDEPGFYSFDLTVFDGTLYSPTSQVIVNVLESPLPRGCVPDLSFIFNYLSDFWSLVEGKERLSIFWGSLAQTAATELFTLWQTEYSKSHRDIQRTFNRRWLHYDLLLGEPLPELTRTRALFGGVTSSAIPVAGSAGIQGTTLVVSSSVLAEDVTIKLTSLDPVTATVLAAELERKLVASADSRFSTVALEDRSSGDRAVRIDAPFPFTISTDSTIPVFSGGDEGRPPSGTGVGLGSHVYRVDRSLEGLGLLEDDFLVLDGVAYRISRVLDEAGDQYSYQRVAVKEALPTVPSSTWSISGWVSSELLDFYSGLVSSNDYVTFEASDSTTENAPTVAGYAVVATTCLGVNENLPSRMAVDFWPIGDALADDTQQVHLASVLRRRYVPVHEDVVDVPLLQELIEIEDDDATLRRNVDFFLETVRGRKCLRFVSGEAGDAGDVWEGAQPPDRLWAEYTYFDNSSVIEANFGIPVDLTVDQLEDLPDTVDYLSAVRGLWHAFFNGPSVRNIRIGVQILLGLPFAERKGVIEEIRTDFSPKTGRMLVRDADNTEIVRAYRWPRVLGIEVNPATGVPYVVGDTLEEFAPIVQGSEVLDYINTPRWYEGLLNQGLFYEVEKFHRWAVKVNAAAFSLNSILFVNNFLKKIRPQYTYPMLIVQKSVSGAGDSGGALGDEVSVEDELNYSGTLKLFGTPGALFNGLSTNFDDPRAAGGGWRNYFDTDGEDIVWAFDKHFLAPDDHVKNTYHVELDGATAIADDYAFEYNTIIGVMHRFVHTSGFIVTATVGLTLTAWGHNPATESGKISSIRLTIFGDNNSLPTDYELVLVVAGVDQKVLPFNVSQEGGFDGEFLVASPTITVGGGQTIGLRIRAGDGSARGPGWSRIVAEVKRVHLSGDRQWINATTPPAAVYYQDKVVSVVDPTAHAEVALVVEPTLPFTMLVGGIGSMPNPGSVGGNMTAIISEVPSIADWLGKLAILGIGTLQKLTSDQGLTPWAFLHGSSGSRIVVCLQYTTGTGEIVNTMGADSPSSVGVALRINSDLSLTFRVGNGSGTYLIDETTAAGTITGNTTHVVSVRRGFGPTGDAYEIRVDGERVALGVEDAAGPSASDPAVTLHFMRRSDGANPYYGRILSLLVLNTGGDVGELVPWERYMQDKWVR